MLPVFITKRHKPKAILHTTTVPTATDMVFADGAWIDGTGTSNNQTVSNWIGFIESTTTVGKIHPYEFNTATKTITTTGSVYTATSGSGSGYTLPVQLSNDRGLMHYRYSDGGFHTYSKLWDLNAGLTGLDNNISTWNGTQWYAAANRAGDDYGFVQGNSNSPYYGFKYYNYTGGGSYTSSAKFSNAVALQDGMTMIGGGSTAKARAADSKQLCYFNDNNNYIGTSTTGIDLHTITWDGVNNSSLVHNVTNDAITLASAGEGLTPQPIATSWGNIVINPDSVDTGKEVVYPITWSGTTPTVGSSVAWTSSIPAHQIRFDGIDGYGFNTGSKFNCGEKPSSPDVYNTFRVYQDAGDVVIDTIEIDFSNSNGSHNVVVKQESVVRFSSSTNETVSWFFPSNGTDLVLFHADTDTFVYIENAYY